MNAVMVPRELEFSGLSLPDFHQVRRLSLPSDLLRPFVALGSLGTEDGKRCKWTRPEPRGMVQRYSRRGLKISHTVV